MEDSNTLSSTTEYTNSLLTCLTEFDSINKKYNKKIEELKNKQAELQKTYLTNIENMYDNRKLYSIEMPCCRKYNNLRSTKALCSPHYDIPRSLKYITTIKFDYCRGPGYYRYYQCIHCDRIIVCEPYYVDDEIKGNFINY